jgi:flagellar basal-body rod protein FlgB
MAMINGLFDGAIDRLSQGLTHAARRHEVLAQNVANLETPGYQGRDLVFDDHLRQVLDVVTVGGAEVLTSDDDSGARIVHAADGPPGPNGNDVRLDRQMARLAENSLYQQTLVQMLGQQFALLKQAIAGRS